MLSSNRPEIPPESTVPVGSPSGRQRAHVLQLEARLGARTVVGDHQLGRGAVLRPGSMHLDVWGRQLVPRHESRGHLGLRVEAAASESPQGPFHTKKRGGGNLGLPRRTHGQLWGPRVHPPS